MKRKIRFAAYWCVAAGVLVAGLGCGKKSDEGAGGGGGSTPTPAAVVVTSSAPATPTEIVFKETEQDMTEFFAALPPAAKRAGGAGGAPADLVGAWQATVVSLGADGEAGALRDPASIPSFSFTIQSANGTVSMASSDGRGTPRTLVATAEGIVAKGAEGAPEMRLQLKDGVLVGSLQSGGAGHERMEFHAIRK